MGRPGLRRAGRLVIGAALVCTLAACAAERPSEDHHEDRAGAWTLTAWGEHYEVFPEIGLLVAGEATAAHVHLTALDGFAPVAEGEVEIVLATGERGEGSGGAAEPVFRAASPSRPGVFDLELRPERPGDYDLLFRVSGSAGSETVRAGRVRVGTADAPGGIVRAPAPRGATGGGEPTAFSKEQQWQTPFATAWVRRTRFARSVEGPAVVRPRAGGESWITAPVAGTLRGEPWPFPGAALPAGAPLFRLLPTVDSSRSLPELRADAAAARDELAAARDRLARLESLLEAEAASVREVEEARTRVEVLESRAAAAGQDLSAASAAREGRGSAAELALRAPFAGRVSRVEASPGAHVEAGEPLARMVRVDSVWLEVALSPADASALLGGVAGVVLPASGGPGAEDGGAELRIGADEVSLVSVAPEVDPRTGRLSALLELPGRAGLAIGSTHTARVLVSDGIEGIVVPAAALVDDGGVPVVYLQLGGESFVRQPVRVLERQGERVLVEGLIPGQRLVTRGADAIRRHTLLEAGAGEGHLH